MKNILILILTFTTSLMTYANDYTYNYLVFTTQDGTEKAIAVENLKLSFVNEQLVVDNGVESQTYSLTSLSKMFFSENTVDGIVETVINGNEDVDVFTVSGIWMGKFGNVDDAKKSLQRGVYVLKQGKTTSKIAIK
ncbi:MAG: hypothetical protein IJL54_04645 [Prevotella sp.]|nr:hypothetical protein [Prevotella sp.]